jgi:heme/copper-type cytochrome/quinol oxidase subunit 2
VVFIAHLLLAVVLTLFLALQVNALVFVLRSRRARGAPRPRRRATDLVWTTIPVVVVLALAARSWVAVFDVERPAVASTVTELRPDAPSRAGLAPSKEPRAIP